MELVSCKILLVSIWTSCRSYTTAWCCFWARNWSYPPGWLVLFGYWNATCWLPAWCNWTVRLMQRPSRWCWTPMRRA